MDTKFLDGGKVRPEHFDAQLCAKAGGEHFGAGLDRHPENVGHARRLDFLVHLGKQLFPSHAGPPLCGRFQFHHGLEHRERCGVSGCFGFAGLAEDRFDFRKLSEQPVLDLQNASRFTDGDAGDGGRHE